MIEFISTTLGNSLIGIAFLGLAMALTFLMFYVWKFPFDHERAGTTGNRGGDIGDCRLFISPAMNSACP
ncbi:MAG: hypothetical protein GY896_21480 [Gammaproteobacteria bacterium]|nr:hypothetical protein [Gammaproteobacteria bacterium]